MRRHLVATDGKSAGYAALPDAVPERRGNFEALMLNQWLYRVTLRDTVKS